MAARYDMTSNIPSSAGSSNRLEEHTAIALMNLDRLWPLPCGGWFRLLDYQVPLKANQADARVGKIDLLGVSDGGGLVVVELKVQAQAWRAQRSAADGADGGAALRRHR